MESGAKAKGWAAAKVTISLASVRKQRAAIALAAKKGSAAPSTAVLASSGSPQPAGNLGGFWGGVVGWFSSVTGLGASEENERFVARSLVLGQPEAAAAGLKVALGLSDDLVLAQMLSKGVDQIVAEFEACGSEDDLANLRYCLHGVACRPSDLPPHVHRSVENGVYHGGRIAAGDFDFGHDGMSLDDFVGHPHSQVAGLSRANVLALRLYTTSSFVRFNKPLRDGVRPHPLRMTVYYLSEGLKSLRAVEARAAPEDFNRVMFLYRGMRDTTIVDREGFMSKGGTETAPMSTSAKREVALSYAQGQQCSLLLQYRTRGLGRGIALSFLSCYPKEEEYLYPPMTYLQPEKMVRDEATACLIVDVTPQMS